ncbi:hypothetical protein ONS95_004494 [Cadophora gregata]|uniref:uncharacterized protein n=1 Tax=Cadophora gregata TaxID=51156 RepID=UPI0026DCFF19|nr:uncharacterized protein ONS95_004494 [Cadophora gregata]KAK0105987.1 hypothetical protein ONS95_004494 [Cadophora gregata]
MKGPITFTFVAASAFVTHVALAQVDPGPSPTNSYDCEPHGDHWHCEGPITPSATLPASVTTPSVAVITTTSHAGNGHSADTGTLAPSPTESVGCEPHGDHWHCDAPAATVTTTGTGAESVTIALSPTESVGCEQHGDHWHCEAPAVTSGSSVGTITSVAANRTVTPSSTQATFIPSNGATLHGAGYGFFAALFILAVSMSL